MARVTKQPHNVRNFWFEAEIDGPRGVQKLSGGPSAATGALGIKVYQRDEGGIAHVLTIEGFTQENGRDLILNVTDQTGECVLQCITKRDAEVR